MTRDELRAMIITTLTEVAPDVSPEDVRGETRLREDLDLDSLDFLDVISGVSQRTGVDIPERDYGELTTLDSFVAYLERVG